MLAVTGDAIIAGGALVVVALIALYGQYRIASGQQELVAGQAKLVADQQELKKENHEDHQNNHKIGVEIRDMVIAMQSVQTTQGDSLNSLRYDFSEHIRDHGTLIKALEQQGINLVTAADKLAHNTEAAALTLATSVSVAAKVLAGQRAHEVEIEHANAAINIPVNMPVTIT